MLRKPTLLTLLAASVFSHVVHAEVPQPLVVNYGNASTVAHALSDDVVHVSFRHWQPSQSQTSAITLTEMVQSPLRLEGPEQYWQSANQFSTSAIQLTANSSNGCVSVERAALRLLTLCPADFGNGWVGASVENTGVHSIYGLGQIWTPLKWQDGHWQGKVNGEWMGAGGFATSGEFGTTFSNVIYESGAYAGGTAPNLQFPVLYAVGEDGLNYAVFVDSKRKLDFNFSQPWWQIRNRQAEQTNMFIISGEDLPSLRAQFMDIVGTPPVPPRKMFGLWMSEFSYDSWWELDETFNALRDSGFPVDGAFLDIAWFGFKEWWQLNSPYSPMGDLTFDDQAFPNASQRIQQLQNDHLGLVTIEESYVSRIGNVNGFTFNNLNARQGFARNCWNGQPIIFNNWFGESGMVDWSNTDAANWLHDAVRKPNIIDLGVMGHWTDLGEPEAFDASACVSVGEHVRDYHNVHNLLWSKSIYDGYVRHHAEQPKRAFSMARAGTVGSHRYGAGLWSGDIGGRLDHMNQHYNSQMHMSLAGIDYYSSDIGGFWRKPDQNGLRDTAIANGAGYSEAEMYSLWFANAAWFDIPLRPHGNNCGMPGASGEDCIATETSPAFMGNVAGNRANVRQRYELMPYYYSLAHRAYANAEPVIAPMVYYYQDDLTVRGMADQKLLGKDILVATITEQFQSTRDVYLPAGTWFNYHSAERYSSTEGLWLRNVPLWHAEQQQNRLPAYVRAGAIVPLMTVDAETKDSFGHRLDGSERNEAIFLVYPAEQPSEFVLYEDDGATVAAYQNQRPVYQTRTTRVQQQPQANGVLIRIDAAQGSYEGAVQQRNNEVRYWVGDKAVQQVRLNGALLPELSNQQFQQAQAQGWMKEGAFVRIKTGIASVYVEKALEIQLGAPSQEFERTVVFIYGTTQAGQDMFVRGGIDHAYAASALGLDCSAEPQRCAIPIRHRNLKNATTLSWKNGDNLLDWHGAEPTQTASAFGTPLDWTTDQWPDSWGDRRTVDADGYGESSLNQWGPHYWMLDVDMDCSRTVNGWFELKSYIANGDEWEADVQQPGAPYLSGNHFAQCGAMNVFQRGEANPVFIGHLP